MTFLLCYYYFLLVKTGFKLQIFTDKTLTHEFTCNQTTNNNFV